MKAVGPLLGDLFGEFGEEDEKSFLPYDDNKTFLELVLPSSEITKNNSSQEILNELQKLLTEYRQATGLKTPMREKPSLKLPGEFPQDNDNN